MTVSYDILGIACINLLCVCHNATICKFLVIFTWQYTIFIIYLVLILIRGCLRRSLLVVESLGGPDDALVTTSLVCHREQSLTRVPAEVGAEIEDGRHGRVDDDCRANAVRHQGHRARTRVLNIDLDPVLKSVATGMIELR